MTALQEVLPGDTSIAGLPADVFAELAREALNSNPDSSAAALDALALLAENSTPAGWSLAGVWEWCTTTAARTLETISDVTATMDPGPLLLVVLALTGALIWSKWRSPRQDAPRRAQGHHETPHRLAYAEAVTQAAQMLAQGTESTVTIARATGLARDVVAVVGSRRLIPAAPTGVVAGTEASSGRKRRRAAATPRGRVLK